MIMRTQCCYQLCLAPDQCAAETMPGFTHSSWHQTHVHSVSVVFQAQWNEQSGLGEHGREQTCGRKWREKGEGAPWESEKGQATVLNMEGKGQAGVIGGCHTELR